MTGLELKIFRVLLNLSQKEAAEEIGGISQRLWAYWECGERTISAEVKTKVREITKRVKETLNFVRDNKGEAKRIAAVFYDDPQSAGMSLLEVRYNNAVVSILNMEIEVTVIPFNPQDYSDWLAGNGGVDSPQKRSEWAAHKALRLKSN